MKNRKTTYAGFISGIIYICNGLATLPTYSISTVTPVVAQGVAMMLLGLLAADSSSTKE